MGSVRRFQVVLELLLRLLVCKCVRVSFPLEETENGPNCKKPFLRCAKGK